MELFYNNGHISEEGLAALAAGTLNELQSLEAAEHLSFCDSCLLEYSEFLDKGALMQPEKPMKGAIMKRIRQKGIGIVFKKYATVAAAACMAIVMWNTVNGAMFSKPVRENDASFISNVQQFFVNFNEGGKKLGEGLDNFFNSFTPKNTQDNHFAQSQNAQDDKKNDDEESVKEQQAKEKEAEKMKEIKEKESKFITAEQREAEFSKNAVPKPDDLASAT